MKIGKILAVTLTSILVMMPAQAVKAQNTVITLDKEAQQFVKVEEDLELSNMQPGEERTAKVEIVNSSGEQMQFYINGELLDNIADKGDQQAVYEIDLQREGEMQPYYQGIMGAEQAADSTELTELGKDTLLATLEDGERTTVLITVALDGESMGNSYMGQTGSIQLNISAADLDASDLADSGIPASAGNAIQAAVSFVRVQTNDTAHVILYTVICIVALAVCITGGVTIRKRKNIEK